MTSKRNFPTTFKIYFIISMVSITFSSEEKISKIDSNLRVMRDINPQLWKQNQSLLLLCKIPKSKYFPRIDKPNVLPREQNQNLLLPFQVSQPKYFRRFVQPVNAKPMFKNMPETIYSNYTTTVTRFPVFPNFNLTKHIPEFAQSDSVEPVFRNMPMYIPEDFQSKLNNIQKFLRNFQENVGERSTSISEVAQPKSDNEIMQRKILGLMMGTAAENALHQMHLEQPEILNTLTGKIIPLAGNQPNEATIGRRQMFSPIIHNTIVNENKNQNQNENKNVVPTVTPYLLPADPNFPLLTHLLDSIIKNSKNPELAEHAGHKPIKICFEL